MVFGIDVSSYNGVIDWAKVKAAGVGHAVLKITMRNLTLDKQFVNNLKGVRVQGIPFSVYRYVYEATEQSAVKSASEVVRLMEQYDIPAGTMVWWDLEDESITPHVAAERNNLRSSILAAQKVIKGAGYGFGIYTGLWWYTSIIKPMGISCPYWIARYPSTKAIAFGTPPEARFKPEVNGTLWGWQFTDAGLVPGCTGNSGHTDLNVVYGLSVSTTTEAPTQCLRKGSKGDAVKLMQVELNRHGFNLVLDGIFGPKTDGAVRAFQAEHGLVVDGICGPKTWSMLIL